MSRIVRGFCIVGVAGALGCEAGFSSYEPLQPAGQPPGADDQTPSADDTEPDDPSSTPTPTPGDDTGSAPDDTPRDTAPPVPTTCALQLHLEVASFGQELGWAVLDDGGAVIAEGPPGSYASNTSVDIPLDLSIGGSYVLRARDSFGDGWQGSLFELTNAHDEVLAFGSMPRTGAQKDYPFVSRCSPPAPPSRCDGTLEVSTARFGDEIGVGLAPLLGAVRDSYPPGSFGDTWDHVAPVTLPDGWARMVLDDVASDGWHGGTVTLRDARGDALAFGTLSTGEGSADVPAWAGCDPIPRTACPVLVHIRTELWGSEVAWWLENSAGQSVAGDPPGTFGDYEDIWVPLTVAPGSYTFFGYDSLGDSWHGGIFEVFVGRAGLTRTGTLANGPTQQSFPLSVSCAP